MDKSESELLEEWDLVSSIYDTEKAAEATEKNSDSQAEKSTDDGIDLKASGSVEDTENVSCSVKDSEADIVEVAESPSEQAADTVVVSDEKVEAGFVEKETIEIRISEEVAKVDSAEVDIYEAGDTEQISTAGAVVEEIMEPKTNIQVDREKKTEAEIETVPDHQKVTDNTIESVVETKDTEIVKVDEEESNGETVADRCTGPKLESGVELFEDLVVNTSLDSSMEHIQIEHCEGSYVQEDPGLMHNLVEQENAGIESSSSDIDIIDENMEESISSSFIHPLSLSISSSVDTSSVLTTPFESEKQEATEKIIGDIKISVKPESHIEKSSSSSPPLSYFESSESCSQKSTFEDRSEPGPPPEPRRPHARSAATDMLAGLLQFFRNMSFFEWSFLGGVMLCVYVTIVFNQTNIFAVVEKENVVSQMKKMIDELKHDNKILKDQMLSEMKNEKVFSSLDHQIKELKKDNSKLNHMLYGVAKVLEEQKDTHKRFQKRESDYIEPFKKEINKLKEYINILKFDNEELQKQLVRMRYASYSQGGRDDSKEAEKQKEETKAEETGEEISLDINALEKWNDLISLLTKELGLSETEHLSKVSSHTERKNISWYWKALLREFEGTFKDFKTDVTSKFSVYKKTNEEAVSKVFKFVKDFFTVEENNNEKFSTKSGEDESQWNNIGDFVKDLSEKWTNIKDRVYTSDLKKFIMDFQKSEKADSYQSNHDSEKTESKSYEYKEQKPTYAHFELHEESDKAQPTAEDSKWMFERAEYRAELRDADKDDQSENWFLKRKKRTSQDDAEKFKY